MTRNSASENLSSLRTQLLQMLKKYSFKTGAFILSSGRRSNFFIDCKQAVLKAEGHYLTGKTLFETIKPYMPINLAGAVAVGGCPLASALSTISYIEGSPIDAIYIRRERKDHGTGKQIDGVEHIKEGSRVVILEDVLTTGASTKFAAELIKSKGAEVSLCVVLVDRQEGGIDILRDEGLNVVAIFTRKDFFDE